MLLAAYGTRLSYSVFFKPMATEMQFDSAITALAYSVSMFLEGVFSFVSHRSGCDQSGHAACGGG
jgi:hypothetical protein